MEITLSSKIYSYVCLRVTESYISYKVKVLKKDLVKVQQSGNQKNIFIRPWHQSKTEDPQYNYVDGEFLTLESVEFMKMRGDQLVLLQMEGERVLVGMVTVGRS